MALQGGSAWLTYGNKIVQNAVGYILVENTFVSKLLQVKLQAFQFNAESIGHVTKHQRPKIGLARLGTNRGEFGAIDLDFVLAIRKTIFKYF